jgi:hypothetical protein
MPFLAPLVRSAAFGRHFSFRCSGSSRDYEPIPAQAGTTNGLCRLRRRKRLCPGERVRPIAFRRPAYRPITLIAASRSGAVHANRNRPFCDGTDVLCHLRRGGQHPCLRPPRKLAIPLQFLSGPPWARLYRRVCRGARCWSARSLTYNRPHSRPAGRRASFATHA